jgi:hypothetical protein
MIYFVSFAWIGPIARTEAGGANRSRWDRSQTVARIADEHGAGAGRG